MEWLEHFIIEFINSTPCFMNYPARGAPGEAAGVMKTLSSSPCLLSERHSAACPVNAPRLGGRHLILLLGLALALASTLKGAGTLTAKSSTDQPIQIRDYHLRVTLNNGFARTEVTQTFFNPNNRDL